MADSNADKIAQVKAFQEMQEANGAKQTALRRQAAQLPEGPERDALLAQREQLKKENREIQSRINQVAPDDPKSAVYEGKDPATGSEVYVNPVTGQRFNASAPPSDTQKANSIPNGAEQSDKARETAIAADNKSTQQGYAPTPQTNENAPASERQTSPVSQEGVNTTVPTGSDSGVGVAEQARQQAAQTPLTEPTQVEIPPNSSQLPEGPTVEGTPPVSPNEDPFEAARLKAAAEQSPSPTEQTVINASQDAKLSQEQQDKSSQAQESQRVVSKAQQDRANNPEGNSTAGSVDQVRTAQTVAIQRNTINKADWRVRLSLAPSAKYLYNIAATTDILYPLKATDGVIFPYTPQIQSSYKATYDSLDLQHSNYKMHFYKNSSVEEITLTADFTAQDTTEANYLLAVMHFFKSVTKMFYGQDGNNGPKAGTPPPLVYLNGYGTYQYNEHPCVVQSFGYTLPNDVDYIRAGPPTVPAGTPANPTQTKDVKGGIGSNLMSLIRKSASNLKTQGKISQEPNWTNYANTEATYLPTKIQFTITLLPVVTRNDISKNFSVELYGTGQLTRGNKRPSGGGIW